MLENRATRLPPADSLPDARFSGAIVPVTSDVVAHVGGITGRGSPAPEWWGHRPRRPFGTGEERPPSRATADGESHSKPLPQRARSKDERRRERVGYSALVSGRYCWLIDFHFPIENR